MADSLKITKVEVNGSKVVNAQAVVDQFDGYPDWFANINELGLASGPNPSFGKFLVSCEDFETNWPESAPFDIEIECKTQSGDEDAVTTTLTFEGYVTVSAHRALRAKENSPYVVVVADKRHIARNVFSTRIYNLDGQTGSNWGDLFSDLVTDLPAGLTFGGTYSAGDYPPHDMGRIKLEHTRTIDALAELAARSNKFLYYDPFDGGVLKFADINGSQTIPSDLQVHREYGIPETLVADDIGKVEVNQEQGTKWEATGPTLFLAPTASGMARAWGLLADTIHTDSQKDLETDELETVWNAYKQRLGKRSITEYIGAVELTPGEDVASVVWKLDRGAIFTVVEIGPPYPPLTHRSEIPFNNVAAYVVSPAGIPAGIIGDPVGPPPVMGNPGSGSVQMLDVNGDPLGDPFTAYNYTEMIIGANPGESRGKGVVINFDIFNRPIVASGEGTEPTGCMCPPNLYVRIGCNEGIMLYDDMTDTYAQLDLDIDCCDNVCNEIATSSVATLRINATCTVADPENDTSATVSVTWELLCNDSPTGKTGSFDITEPCGPAMQCWINEQTINLTESPESCEEYLFISNCQLPCDPVSTFILPANIQIRATDQAGAMKECTGLCSDDVTTEELCCGHWKLRYVLDTTGSDPAEVECLGGCCSTETYRIVEMLLSIVPSVNGDAIEGEVTLQVGTACSGLDPDAAPVSYLSQVIGTIGCDEEILGCWTFDFGGTCQVQICFNPGPQDDCLLFRVKRDDITGESCVSLDACKIPQVEAVQQIYNVDTCEYEDCGDPVFVKWPILKDMIDEAEDLDENDCVTCLGVEPDQLLWAMWSQDFVAWIAKDCPWTGEITVPTAINCDGDNITFFFSVVKFVNGSICSVKTGPEIACPCDEPECCADATITVEGVELTVNGMDSYTGTKTGITCGDCTLHPDHVPGATYTQEFIFDVTCEEDEFNPGMEFWNFSAGADCTGISPPVTHVVGGTSQVHRPCGPGVFMETVDLYSSSLSPPVYFCSVTFLVEIG